MMTGTVPATAGRMVTLESLIDEMMDIGVVARWPDPGYTCLQASSHDRRTVSPDRDGWFANDDHTQYIREEMNGGRKERVMMDADGPGCIVRFWLTTVENKRGVLRIYLDGDAKPALVFPAYDLLAGDLGLPAAIAIPHPGYKADGNGGNTLMLPVPYARHCKVTWEEEGSGPRYYQINFRRYAPGTEVETFNRARFEGARAAIVMAADRLIHPPSVAGPSLRLESILAAGKEVSMDLPMGAGAVRQMQLRLVPDASEDIANALRTIIVRITFDGVNSVWCPAGDFFGSGVGLNPLQSWYRTVSPDGLMTCRWVMPYESSARITLINCGTKPTQVELACVTGPWTWDSRSMHFHSAWHYEGSLRTPPARDWNYLRLAGRGVYMGDTLSLYNEIATWYGEGDEKIRVDGEALPSHLGTGTEDYYDYSFAPRGIMQTPFANQVRVDQSMTQGHNVLTRTRNLDGIPYRKSLEFDIELISWVPTRMIYAATTYWYAVPGGTSNRVPEVENAAAAIPTLADAQRPPAAFPGVLDAELLEMSDKTPGWATESQNMQGYGAGVWSRGEQLLGRATEVGNRITLKLPVPDGSPRALYVAATRAPDFGILSFTVNGKPAITRFDGYCPSVTRSEEILLGTFKPVGGELEVKVEVSGTNPASKGARYYFGIDCFVPRDP